VRTCETCGTSIEGRHPKARFCTDVCRSRHKRGYRAKAGTVVALPTAPEPEEPEALPTLVDVAAELARQLRSQATPPTAKAALAREYRATLAEIEKNQPRAKDGIDEIAERRARRAGA
jgi:hypothetical protein